MIWGALSSRRKSEEPCGFAREIHWKFLPTVTARLFLKNIRPSEYAETLSKTSGHPACITDKDNIIAVSGVPKRELSEKKISPDIEKVMEDKATFIMKRGENRKLSVIEGSEKYTAGVVVPIIAEGDTIGSVVFFSNETAPQMGEVEEKLAHSAAGFLGRHMEQ